ncbi:hypothetical protein CXB51_002184 [Gossypium anomalum]|uniref:Glabrous enhancer-binding protein-like DBD domain-containing protein n=1 Tax=Gossypium anomalum TaxID=47600 RepID=A0A8J6DBC8_9ROSI|nr:hypothetical protein CXB51_002184 [Gossypium anomalum]
MAPKRSNPIEVPPAASSSEEDEEVTSSEEEEEGSSTEEEDEEDPKTESTPLIQKSPPPRKPETATPGVVNDESDESGSDSESESDTATPNVKPLATKPMEESLNAKKPRSNKPLNSPIRASSSKRPGELELDAKEAKRPKKKVGEEGLATTPAVEEVKKTGEDAKKQLFQRLFSEDDEIALLKGMLDYSAKKGADPCADMNAFYNFVKKSIHTDVTKAQMMDKIRRLKKKFENNAGKGKKGEDRTFSKAHEQNAFELSKMIWGKEGISGKVESSAAKSNGKAKGNNKAAVALKAEFSSPDKKTYDAVPIEADKLVSKSSGSLFDKRFGVSDMEEAVVKLGLDMVDGEKKAALEAKWRKLQIAQLELFVERSELVTEQAKLVLEYYKSEDK